MCKFCGGGETEENSDGLMVLCDCCMAVGTHLKCLHNETGQKIELEDVVLPSFQWFCGEVPAPNIFFFAFLSFFLSGGLWNQKTSHKHKALPINCRNASV